jgi:pimeloyl-ACP methyl ester carboxylesterase
MKTINLQDGTTLSVHDAGNGTPLLFVHGFPLDHTQWNAQLSVFAQTHRVLAPDLRGFGASEPKPGTMTMEQFADDLAALLDSLQIAQPAVLCGLSMGGYIAFQFARKYASRLKALVLCDTRAVADTPEGAQARRKMADEVQVSGVAGVADAMLPKLLAPDTKNRHAEAVEAVRTMISAASPAGISAAQRGMAARPDSSQLLSQINIPTLVLVGQHDSISTVDEMRTIASAISSAQFQIIADAGHLSPLENSAAFNSALRDFLATL